MYINKMIFLTFSLLTKLQSFKSIHTSRAIDEMDDIYNCYIPQCCLKVRVHCCAYNTIWQQCYFLVYITCIFRADFISQSFIKVWNINNGLVPMCIFAASTVKGSERKSHLSILCVYIYSCCEIWPIIQKNISLFCCYGIYMY